MTKSEYEHIISLLIVEIDEWRQSRSAETKGTQADVDAWFGKEEAVDTTADADHNAAANFWFNEGAKIAEDYDNLMDYTEGFEEEAFRVFQEDAQEIRELNTEAFYRDGVISGLNAYIDKLEKERDWLKQRMHPIYEWNLYEDSR